MDSNALLSLEQYNPWLVDASAWPAAGRRFLPEHVVARDATLALAPDTVELIVGPRRAGKSTLIWLALHERERPPLVVNLDDALLRPLCVSGAHFLADTAVLKGPWSALVFEEVQNLEEAGLFLKSLVDLRPGLPVVATGSSSYHLRARTRESLAGRATRTLLYPYGVNELAGAEAGSTPAHRRPSRLRELVEEMTVFGGYPQVWQAVAARTKQTVLLNLVESLVLRDASDCFHIRHPQAFRTILRLAATQAGNLLNLSEWAALAGISVGTVSDYVSILEESHIVRLLPPFLGGRRAEITSTPKVFFLDNGIRNLLHGGFEPFAARGDRGLVLENFVFTEVVKALGPLDEVAFWRTKNQAEVDFVVRRGDRLVPVEVKAAETARLNVPRALHSFLGAYRPPAALMATPAIQGTEVVGETRVEFVAPEGVRAAVQRLLSSD